MRTLLLSVPVFVLMAACDGPTAVQEDLPAPEFAKVTIMRDGPISLTGSSTFNVFLPMRGEWFLDDFRCPINEAELTFGESHEVVLTTTEGGGCGGRTLVWPGELTPGGSLKLHLDPEQAPSVAEHTGCALNGTFPVYHGSFDGELLSVAGHFFGQCDGGTVWGPLMGFPDDPGPVNAAFGLELEVVVRKSM